MVHRDRLSEETGRRQRSRARRRLIGLVVVALGLAWGLALWRTHLALWLEELGGPYFNAAGKAFFFVLIAVGLALRGRSDRPTRDD